MEPKRRAVTSDLGPSEPVAAQGKCPCDSAIEGTMARDRRLST